MKEAETAKRTDEKKPENTGCTTVRRYVGSALAEELVLSLIRAHITAERASRSAVIWKGGTHNSRYRQYRKSMEDRNILQSFPRGRRQA